MRACVHVVVIAALVHNIVVFIIHPHTANCTVLFFPCPIQRFSAGFEPFMLQYCLELDSALVHARKELLARYTPETAAAAQAEATAAAAAASGGKGGDSVGVSALKTGFCEIYDMGGDGVPNYSSRAFGAAKHFIKLAKVLDINFPERQVLLHTGPTARICAREQSLVVCCCAGRSTPRRWLPSLESRLRPLSLLC